MRITTNVCSKLAWSESTFQSRLKNRCQTRAQETTSISSLRLMKFSKRSTWSPKTLVGSGEAHLCCQEWAKLQGKSNFEMTRPGHLHKHSRRDHRNQLSSKSQLQWYCKMERNDRSKFKRMRSYLNRIFQFPVSYLTITNLLIRKVGYIKSRCQWLGRCLGGQMLPLPPSIQDWTLGGIARICDWLLHRRRTPELSR
jgi:hypothetical protein